MSSATWNNIDYKSNLDFSCHNHRRKLRAFLYENTVPIKKPLEMNIQTCHMACGEHPHTQFHLINPIEHLRRPSFYNRSESRMGMYFSEEKLFPNQTHCHSSISEVAKPSNWQDIRLIRNTEGACSNFCVFCLLKQTPDICYFQYSQSKTIEDAISLLYYCQPKKYC